MKALLVYGTKRGSTKKIAEEISAVLRDEGFQVQMADAKEKIEDVGDYDLVVVGSALNLRSWLKGPVKFMRLNREVLKTTPVWLFSSGLMVKDPRSVNPKVVSEFDRDIEPREHRFFAGSLDPKKLRLAHRAVLRLPGVRGIFPTGDFRDWKEIHNWAMGIARSFDVPQAENEGKEQSGASAIAGYSRTHRNQTVIG